MYFNGFWKKSLSARMAKHKLLKLFAGLLFNLNVKTPSFFKVGIALCMERMVVITTEHGNGNHDENILNSKNA